MGSALLELPELAEARPLSLRDKVIRYSRRAPGRLTLLLVALILLCVATGLAGALEIQQRRAVLAEVTERGGPLSTAAVEIYKSLSDADATAAGAFLVTPVEPPDLRDRYLRDLMSAGEALSTASAGSPTGDSATTVAELTAYLPLYAGLIETARGYNRQDYPQGAAYLREASDLVQQTMLPKAERLFQAETVRLERAQSEASAFAWVTLVLGLLTLGALVAVQINLARGTRRIFNAGLLAATLLAVGAVGWLVIASARSAGQSSASRTEGTAQVEAFARARIAALQARGNEALTLVARGNGQDYERRFQGNWNDLDRTNGLLAKASAAAGPATAERIAETVTAWHAWVASHHELRETDDGGEYNKAVSSATSLDAAGTRMLSAKVDEQLGAAIDQATNRFYTEAASARNALSTVDVWVAILMMLAVLGVVVGFAPRLREFR